MKKAYGGPFYKDEKRKNHISNVVESNIHKSSKINRILFLAYYFPPMGSSPIQRTLKYVKYLSQMGYSITVITTDDKIKDMDNSLIKEVPENVRVIRIHAPFYGKEFTVKEERERIFDFISNIDYDDTFFDEWMLAEKTQCNYILPDRTITWATKAYYEIDKYVNFNDIDVVYSTAPYWSPHLLGYSLKKKYGIPWIADYRDPWMSDELYALKVYPFMTSEERIWFRRLEGIIISKMDRIVVAGDNWIKGFIDTYGVEKNKIECITNGYDEDDFVDIQRSSEQNKVFTLCYNGALGYNRKPQHLLEVISDLINEGKINKDKICWIFNGDVEGVFEELIKPYDKYGIVIKNGFLNHKDSLKVAINADVMVMYGETGKMASLNYPGKFFEYLRIGVPILCFSGAGSPQQKILEETGLGVNFDLDDKIGMRNYILCRYNLWESGKIKYKLDKKKIEKYDRINLSKRMSNIFCSLKVNSK